MEKESEGGGTAIHRYTRDEAIHELERRRVRDEEEDEGGVERVFHFQTKGESHLVKMWIVFRDPKTVFNHPDKYVFEMVADEDIVQYQKGMVTGIGGHMYEFLEDVYFLQPFFTSKDDVEYFARKYKIWTDRVSS